MNSNTALRVHTPTPEPLPTRLPTAPDQFLALFEHPEARRRITPLLAPGDDYERIVACVAKATRKEPKLLECSTTTLLDAAATIVAWRLEVGETAYLIPYKGKVVPVMGYLGMAQILITSGVVRAIEPTIVYENDTLDIEYGTESHARVVPPKGDAPRGAMIGALMTFRLKFGHWTFRYITVAEVDEIRQKYSLSWKSGPVPPWYMLKTLLRQSIKFLNTTPALQKAFARIEEDEQIELSAIGEHTAETEEAFGSPASQPLQLEKGEPADAETEKPLTLERTMSLEDALAFIIPRGKMKDHAVAELTNVQRQAALLWTVEKDAEPEFQLALATVLDAQEKEPAPDAGAPEDSPAGNDVTSSPAPVAAPAPFALEEEDPYPEADPKSMSTAALQAEALRSLQHPVMREAFVVGMLQQIGAGLTHVQLQATVRELRAMIAAAPPPRRKGERRAHSIGNLPGDPA